MQAPIHAGLGRYATKTADVSGVSDRRGVVTNDTADTAVKNQTYQAKPNIHAGCTRDTAETCKTIDTEPHAANQLRNDDLLTVATVPKRLFRQRGPWLTARQAEEAAAYHLHHLHCPQCIAAGRGAMYGQRCGIGLALWGAYEGSDKDWQESIEI